MHVFLRKALRVGPLRFNLSKSGIGVSAGVPGLRVGLIGPRGHYIYAGRKGLYYRRTLGRPGEAARSKEGAGIAPTLPSQLLPDASEPLLEDVTGATVMQMAASSSSDLINQLTESARVQSVWGWAAGLGAMASAAAFVLFWPLGFPVLLATVAAAWWLRQRDLARKAVVVFYDVNDQYAQNFETLINEFAWVSDAQRKRRVMAHGSATGYQKKIHAGAEEIERVIPVAATITGPKQLTTNVSVPSLEDAQRAIHFLPDRVLIREGSDFAELHYQQLTVETAQVRWIEQGAVPADARQVDTTWRYVNKSGGPDRRFKDNRQLPILLLSSLRLSATNGLDAVYHLSNPEAAVLFARALGGMRDLDPQP